MRRTNLAPRECRSAARYSGKGVHEAARVIEPALLTKRDVSGAIGDNGGSAPH
jgi:hypothetical protein